MTHTHISKLELLEALEELLITIPQHDFRGMSPCYPDALNQAKKAIAKARGQSANSAAA
jgi:hypothetical protein